MAFRQYKDTKKSIGLLMYILYDAYQIDESDHWQYGSGTIERGGKPIGSYEWNENASWARFNLNDPNINERISRRIDWLLKEEIYPLTVEEKSHLEWAKSEHSQCK